jgi:hypothetical protein
MGLSYKTVLLASAARAPFTGFLLKDGQESITVAKSNGAGTPVYFGAIEGGTVLGRIAASGKYRPCAKQIVNGAYGPGVVVPMQSVDNFEVGDIVTVFDASDPTTPHATGRAIVAIDRVASPPTLTLAAGNVTVAAGDYIFVEDGSGTARGILDSDGVSTLAGQDANGLARYEDADGILVFRGVVDQVKVDAVNKLNSLIIADLVNQGDGADITFR